MMKGTGRGIWVALMAQALDSEGPMLFPSEVTAVGSTEPVRWESAAQYFRYLFAEAGATDDPRQAIPTQSLHLRLLPDLKASFLAGAGVPEAPFASAFDNQYCAWHVCVLRDDASADAPFLISRNVHVENGRIVKTGDGTALVPLDDIEPFGRQWAV